MKIRKTPEGVIRYHSAYCDNPFSDEASYRVRIAEDGSISSIAVIVSAGNERTNLFACSIIRKAVPFEPPPNGVTLERGLLVSFSGTAPNQPPSLKVGLAENPSEPITEPKGKGTAHDYAEIARKYAVRNELSTARRYLEKAKALATAKEANLSTRDRADLLVSLADVYEKVGDANSALGMYREAIRLDESLRENLEILARIDEMTRRSSHGNHPHGALVLPTKTKTSSPR